MVDVVTPNKKKDFSAKWKLILLLQAQHRMRPIPTLDHSHSQNTNNSDWRHALQMQMQNASPVLYCISLVSLPPLICHPMFLVPVPTSSLVGSIFGACTVASGLALAAALWKRDFRKATCRVLGVCAI